MKRNNKGFTLIELLAAVVILGILIGVSIPIITGLLDNSKAKMYINDAKKLISQAEYKLKSSSSDIEKPDEGDCILISLVYLDNSDFDNPPGDGEYEKESSYVLVKNKNGKLEYAVTLVEKVKNGGYRGVELVKREALFANNATSHVVGFKEDDVLNVETDINRGYINEKLGAGYMPSGSVISGIYNYPDLADNSASSDIPGAPKITLASLVSASNKGYNSLDATLQLKVEDKDTPRNKLKVFISGTSYDAATTAIDYGNNETFSYNINFAAAPYNKTYDGSGVKLYIKVRDPEGNETKKTMTYKLHNNVAPEIDSKSAISKREKDKANMTTALLKLIVSDDIDGPSGLKVCFKESTNSNEVFDSCDSYVRFNSIFSADNTTEYEFTCGGGGCVRDGSTHYLTVFVKDTGNAVSKKKFTYKFSTNEAPKITEFTLKSKKESFTETGSKTVVINVTATDDVDKADDMKIQVSTGTNGNPKTFNYSQQPVYYTVDAPYDGSNVSIVVKVVDSEGKSTSKTQSYTMYKNTAPSVTSFSLTSASTVCTNQALCPPDEGGSKNTIVSIKATDDIDSSKLQVCFSLDKDNCDDYHPYSEYSEGEGTYEIPGNYDGKTKTVYAFVKDSYGLVGQKSTSYKLYGNQAPTIRSVMLDSKSDASPAEGNLNTVLYVSAYDDFDSANELKIKIVENNVTKVDNANFSSYANRNVDYKLSGGYDGKNRKVVVTITDSSGAAASYTVDYLVYDNDPPTVETFDVYSTEQPCRDEAYCPIEESGHYRVFYQISVSDDLDEPSDIMVCVSETNSCTNYTSYTNYLENDEPKEISHVFSVANANKPFDGTVKHLYLFVKDTNGEITTEDFEYALYNNKGPSIIEGPEIVANGGGDAGNAPDITYSIAAEDDIDETFNIAYCYKKNGGSEVCTAYEEYTESKILDNSFFNVSPPNGETFVIYAKLKDSYGKVTTTEEITYKLMSDGTPSINYSGIIKGTKIYKNSAGNVVTSLDGVANPSTYSPYTRMKIAFSVDDPYDQFKVCVSENENSCTSYYNTVYDANNCSSSDCEAPRTDYYVEYDKSGHIAEGDPINLYLYAKDAYGHTTHKTLYSGFYTVCNDKDEEDAEYTYEFNATKTQEAFGHTDPISIDRCAGQCYYYNPVTDYMSDIFAVYKVMVKYTDKFDSNYACNNGNAVTSYEEYTCDFKDCFYKNGNYQRYAVGTNLQSGDPFTVNVGGQDYVCEDYYVLYLSEYTDKKKKITLNKTETKICKELFDEGYYQYNSSSSNPYVRVVD